MNIGNVNDVGFNGIYKARVGNPLGLHLSPSSVITKLSKLTDKPIYLSVAGSKPLNARGSIMSILSLEPVKGKEIRVSVAEDYPKNILKAILDCINSPNDNTTIKILDDFNKTAAQKVNVIL